MDNPTISRHRSPQAQQLNAILHAIEQGIVTESTHNRLLELESQKEELNTNLKEETEFPKPDKEMIGLYQAKVKELSKSIYEPEIKNAAMDALRPLNRQNCSKTNKLGRYKG